LVRKRIKVKSQKSKGRKKYYEKSESDNCFIVNRDGGYVFVFSSSAKAGCDKNED
jgi:hypothetical protein